MGKGIHTRGTGLVRAGQGTEEKTETRHFLQRTLLGRCPCIYSRSTEAVR